MNYSLHTAIMSHQESHADEVADNLQAANSVTPRNAAPQQGTTKKYWVGIGNNSAVVKSVLKQRYWWQKATREEFSDCDFIWTAWKKQKHIDFLMSNQKQHFDLTEDSVVNPTKVYNKLEQNK